MKSILDPTFRYVPSVETDLRKTFARIRRERAAAQKPPPHTPAAPDRVVPIIIRRQRRPQSG